MAAAVGSLRRRSTFNPAIRAASLVAWRCESSKYAGTVTTAPKSSPPRLSSARARSAWRISADTCTGERSPAAVSIPTMPGASTNRYGSAPYLATSATPRPMNRFTDAMVLAGSSAACASAS